MAEKTFKELKEEIRQKCNSITSIHCPALKADIIFNSNSFHHLVYDGSRKERSKRVQKNKFMFFDNAVKIIKQTTTIQEYRRALLPFGKKDASGYRISKLVQWFSFTVILNFTKRIRIRVIVRKVGEDGEYSFWSVMPDWNLSNNVRMIGSEDIEDK